MSNDELKALQAELQMIHDAGETGQMSWEVFTKARRCVDAVAKLQGLARKKHYGTWGLAVQEWGVYLSNGHGQGVPSVLQAIEEREV